MKKYVVSVPVMLHLEVSTIDERYAHWEAVQAERWMWSAVNLALADEDDNATCEVAPENFGGYRVVADFDRATALRGSLDLDSEEWQEPRALPDGVQGMGVNRNVTVSEQAGEVQE